MIRLLWVLLCIAPQAYAASYEAAQGEVLRIPVPIQGNALTVHTLGKTWPIFEKNGQKIAWIAIHLKTKPGTYPIQWSSDHTSPPYQHTTDTIQVVKGDFRVSHITVEKKMASFDKAALERIRADHAAIQQAYQTPTSIQNTWPAMIMPTKGVISTPFAAQRYVNGKPRSPHSGLDIAAPTGTPVKAPLAGEVVLVADMFLNGLLVVIGHGDGIHSIYAHLHKTFVKQGDILKQGDVFAEVGTTGRSTGPHLHWGVQFHGNKINPLSML